MATIVKRGGLGRSLSTAEMDANFENLNNEILANSSSKLNAADGTATGTLSAENITATGDIQADNLVNTDLKGYGEVMLTTDPSTGSINLDLSAANIFRLNLTGNTTVTFTNPPAAGSTSVATIVAIQDGSGGHTITWTDGAFAGGVAPPASTGANEVDIWTAFTYDQGTSYVVSLSMKDVS